MSEIRKPSSITQVVYLSRATQHVDRAALIEIASVSTANNRRIDVTGALAFCSGYFIQFLEGAPAIVDALLNKLALDPRHVDIQVIQRREGVVREFGQWEMGSMHETTMSPQSAARVARCIELVSAPDLMSRLGSDARQLVTDLQIAIASELQQQSLARAA